VTTHGTTGVSVYDRLVWPEGAIEALLASGARRRELVAFLGEEEYQALRPLAIAAARATRDPERLVVLVPGIMGSLLGSPRESPAPADVLWIDPQDFQGGGLIRLALPDNHVRSLGPVLYNYLPLKLGLEACGYTVRYHDYDWRRDIGELGLAFARRLAGENARQLTVIGHSMGGLVGRVALRSMADTRVTALITLGTPHEGSFAPLQALRGVYPLVRRIAQLDPSRTAETLAREVFSTFPSLYQMLPVNFGGLDLFDARNWPAEGPQPNATLLSRAQMLDLGGADPRITCIAGFGQETVTDAATGPGGFRYTVDRLGDGTVPTRRSIIAGCDAWYCEAGHSELPRTPAVHAALLALLGGNRPDLQMLPPSQDSIAPAVRTDPDLSRAFADKIDWAALDPASRHRFLHALNESAPAALPL
jgi:pimeloyl-ACP methyl ester carboxylesterase